MLFQRKIFLFLIIVLLVPAIGHAEPEITLKPGKFEIKGDGITVRLGGRIQADMAFYDPDPENDALSNGAELRRSRLFVSGSIQDVWRFKGQYDFADPDDPIRDAYIRYTGLPVSITVGHLKNPFSLEAMMSSKYVTFMERGLPSVFAPGRGVGIGLAYANTGLIAAASATNKLEDGGASVADGNDIFDVAARVSYDFLHDSEGQVGHLGAGVHRRDYGGAETVRFRQRPESHVTDARLVDTGVINNPAHHLAWTLDAAWDFGPFSTQGEYTRVTLDANEAGGASREYEFDGYYVEAGWMITGESRRYQKGKFRSPKPKRDVGKGGVGAWQVALRHSTLDLSDTALTAATATDMDNITLGVSWWPTETIRFSANYVRASADRLAAEEQDVDVLQMRAQIEF